MTFSVSLLPEARAEFDEAVDWYDSQRRGLGSRFLDAVQATLDSLSVMPLSHQRIYKDIRRKLVRKYPYSILYRVEADRVLVVAIFHQRRDPSIWQSRV